MSKYIDGFVIPISKDKIDQYTEIARQASVIWKEHGALEYMECAGDDLEHKDVLSFLKMAGCGPDETVLFSWIVFESREHRDQVNAKVMQDPRIEGMCGGEAMPFDCKRMAYGGFKPIVAA